MAEQNRGRTWTGTLLAATLLVIWGGSIRAGQAQPVTQPVAAAADWPQYCGPNRDSIVANSPKLLGAWPAEGPPLVWKSDWIGGWTQGGCGGPVVADGKVFVYATAKNPVGGGNLYKLVTPEVLAAAGWMADLPADLAKKIEEARILKDRPNCKGWSWWIIKDPTEKAKELDGFLAKNPELDKYIKDFIATLKPEDAKKYGDFIKKRLCITSENRDSTYNGITWDGLEKLSKLQGVGYPTLREWSKAWIEATHMPGLTDHLGIGGYLSGFLYQAWCPGFTRSDSLACLDATTGKTLWKKDFPVDADMNMQINLKGGTHNALSYLGLSGTPLVSDGKCYFAGLSGLYCLSAKDGTLLWQVKCLPFHSSVLVTNGVLYYCGAAYDAETGRLLWKTPLWKGVFGDGQPVWGCNTPPSLWKSGGKTYILAHNGAHSGVCLMCCLDLETGKDLWTVKVTPSMVPICYAVRSGSDILVVEGKTYRMTPTALEPLKTLEKTGVHNGYMPGVLSGDNYYAETGGGESGPTALNGLCCWDYTTGEVKWSGPEVCMLCEAPPIVADGKLIIANGYPGQEGWIYTNWNVSMIKDTPEKYMPLGTFKPDMIPWTPLALAGGKLFVRTEIGISCYDLTQHGLYFDKTVVTKDTVTFAFKQTGGGLALKDEGAGLKDVVITEPAGPGKPAKPAKPAAATIVGDTVVVDIKDVPVPFGISCGATNVLVGKNGKPVPAFEWNEARILKFRTCFDNTIVLTSNQILPQNGTWNAAATYAVIGATVTNAKVDPVAKTVTLTTDKTWKAGDAGTLTYPRFHVDQGEAVRETLTFTAREGSASKFVKMDDTTSGSWKGIYGAQGAVIAGDATATTKCAVVTVTTANPGTSSLWPTGGATNDARAPQKWGEAKDRIAACWTVGHPAGYFQIDVEFTDGKEHQVALYCLDWDKADKGRSMTVEAWDPWRNVALVDKQAVKEFGNGKYLVWNLKGHVALRLQSAGSWYNAVASGLFFDAPAPAGK